MLANKVIKPSNSPWASPVVLVKEKDGSSRFCIDYRKLNEITTRDIYPLSRIEDCLGALGGNAYFSSLDLFAGYWQIPMDEKDKQKTAFIVDGGLFEFNVMPFGLTNATATFQRFMDLVLAGLKWNSLLVYLDDVCIFGKTFGEHLKNLEDTFKRLRAYNLKLNPSKCNILKREFLYLGHIITAKGIRADPSKISAVVNMPAPKNVKQLRAFLGKCNYYRKFIKDYSKQLSPLYELIKESSPWDWNSVAEETFELAKRLLSSTPVLIFPDYEEPFIVQTDACDEGLGGVLSQEIEGVEMVIQFISRTLQPNEKKWCPREKEALAIIYACETFRPYVYGTQFIVYTDHHSLQWLMKATAPARLVRWALRLSEFDFVIRYRKGDSNANADALPRLPIETSMGTEMESSEFLAALGGYKEWSERLLTEQRNNPENADLSYKISHRWRGPYSVVAKIDAVTYRVRSDGDKRISNFAVHVQRMKAYKPWRQ